jgi:integrase
MGRRRVGPRRRANGGLSWYACFNVPKSFQALAGRKELWKSLGTSNHSEALRRYPAVMDVLEKEFKSLVQGSSLAEEVELVRQEGIWTPEGRLEDPVEIAEIITTGRADREVVFPLVYKAIKHGQGMAISWNELRDLYAKVRHKKTGLPLSSSALFEVDKGIELMARYAPYPDLLTVQHCRQIYKDLDKEDRLKAKTIMTRLGMAKTMIKVGIKNEALNLESNPWDAVDFIVQDRPEDAYRPFAYDEVKQLFAITKHPQVWYLLFGTALRIGELWSREPSHIDGEMLMVIPTERQNRLKTQTSNRRVPLNAKAVQFLRQVVPYPLSKDTLQRKLRSELDSLSTRDDRLVIHSTRHTWKTWSRRVGIPIDVSDEIDGHKKTITTKVSDGYGIYPDELLLEQNQKVWDYLDGIIGAK